MDQLAGAAATAGFDPNRHDRLQRGGAGVKVGSEVEEVLRALVEGELRCLGSVLDRRREIGESGRGRGGRMEG